MEEIFALTMKRYGIQGKALSDLSGVSVNHISEFKNKRLKTGVTTDCLLRLLDAMDELSPGAKRFFCEMLAGSQYQRTFSVSLETLINAADEEELKVAMFQIVHRVFPKSEEITDAEFSNVRVKSFVLY